MANYGNLCQLPPTARAVPPIPPAKAQVPNIPNTVFLTLSGYQAPSDFIQFGQH